MKEKHMKYAIVVMAVLILAGCATTQTEQKPYDPNDAAYKYIPAAPPDWIEMFGDNERTRLLHTISELRVVVGNIGKRMMEPVVDPNEVTK
jgi:hypothetical protein